MKVSLLQMKTLETPEENIVKIKEMLKEAKAAGADMAVLPEMCCCPYENSAFVNAKQSGTKQDCSYNIRKPVHA